jgi:hypothetical protein
VDDERRGGGPQHADDVTPAGRAAARKQSDKVSSWMNKQSWASICKQAEIANACNGANTAGPAVAATAAVTALVPRPQRSPAYNGFYALLPLLCAFGVTRFGCFWC